MTTGFARFYGGLFLATQVLGLVMGVAGLVAPNLYLTWMRAPGSTHAALAMIGLSLAWPIYVWRARLTSALILLALYHLGGVAGLEVFVRSLAAGLLEGGLLSGSGAPAAAATVALQDPDLAMISLAHSAFGLVGGLLLMKLVHGRASVEAGSPTASIDDGPGTRAPSRKTPRHRA